MSSIIQLTIFVSHDNYRFISLLIFLFVTEQRKTNLLNEANFFYLNAEVNVKCISVLTTMSEPTPEHEHNNKVTCNT